MPADGRHCRAPVVTCRGLVTGQACQPLSLDGCTGGLNLSLHSMCLMVEDQKWSTDQRGDEMASAPSKDAEVFCEFVAARSAALFRVAYLLVGDHHLAQDLLQESLVKTYVAWPKLRDVANAEAYTRRVLVTTTISWRRRRSFHERPFEFLPEPVGVDPASALVLHDALWGRCWSSLRGSVRRSYCATTRTCPRPRPPRPWAARSAR